MDSRKRIFVATKSKDPAFKRKNGIISMAKWTSLFGFMLFLSILSSLLVQEALTRDEINLEEMVRKGYLCLSCVAAALIFGFLALMLFLLENGCSWYVLEDDAKLILVDEEDGHSSDSTVTADEINENEDGNMQKIPSTEARDSVTETDSASESDISKHSSIDESLGVIHLKPLKIMLKESKKEQILNAVKESVESELRERCLEHESSSTE